MNTVTTHHVSAWRRGLAVSSTKTSLTALAATTTRPVTVDTDDPDATGNKVVIPCGAQKTYILPYGTNADNEAFNIAVVLWRSVRVEGGTTLWVPYEAGQALCTLSAFTGVDGSVVENEQFFADTIAEVGTTWNDSIVTGAGDGAAGDKPAILTVNTIGFELIEIDFDLTTATSANCLLAQA